MQYSTCAAKKCDPELNYEAMEVFQVTETHIYIWHSLVLNRALVDWLISNQYLIKKAINQDRKIAGLNHFDIRFTVAY